MDSSLSKFTIGIFLFYLNMKGTFDLVPQINAKMGEYGVKKNLSPEELQELADLKQQRAELQKQIRDIDTSSDAVGKRVARRKVCC